MKVLLTGGSGFVGKHLQKHLSTRSAVHSMTGVDIRHPRELLRIIEHSEPDVVIHLAAQSFVPESFKNPNKTFDINFMGTLNLLTALKQSHFHGKLIFVSSGDVYGIVSDNDLPISEKTIPHPRNPYSVSKLAAETLCYQWSQTENMDIVIARPFNHIGPGQSQHFVVSSFAKQVMEIKLGLKENIIFVGDIDVYRDFTDVRDVVMAYKALISSGMLGEVYNICTGTGHKIRDILYNLIALANIKADVQIDKNRLRISEQRKIFGSCKKLKMATGWTPRYPIKKSLLDMLYYWEKELA